MIETPTLPDFTDTSRWTAVTNVPVFEERLDTDAQGQVVNRIDHARLEKIAANSNARDARGIFCALAIGHTRDGSHPEELQPRHVGYARHFQVAWDDTLHKWVIRATYYLRKDAEAEARTFPRSSVEHWRQEDFLDPIALIRQTAKCDLPQWTYARAGRVTRYARDSSMNDPVKTPDASDADKDFHTKVMKCVKEGYPHLDRMHSEQAARYAAAVPGSTNGGLAESGPHLSGEQTGGGMPPNAPPIHHPRPFGPAPEGKDMPEKFGNDAERIRYQRVQDQVLALQNQLRQGQAEGLVKQLVYEGYDVDPAAECQHFMRLPNEHWVGHMDYVRSHYRRSPISQPLISTLPGAAAGAAVQPSADDELSTAQLDKALAYMRAGKCPSSDPREQWIEAVKSVKSK